MVKMDNPVKVDDLGVPLFQEPPNHLNYKDCMTTAHGVSSSMGCTFLLIVAWSEYLDTVVRPVRTTRYDDYS